MKQFHPFHRMFTILKFLIQTCERPCFAYTGRRKRSLCKRLAAGSCDLMRHTDLYNFSFLLFPFPLFYPLCYLLFKFSSVESTCTQYLSQMETLLKIGSLAVTEEFIERCQQLLGIHKAVVSPTQNPFSTVWFPL